MATFQCPRPLSQLHQYRTWSLFYFSDQGSLNICEDLAFNTCTQTLKKLGKEMHEPNNQMLIAKIWTTKLWVNKNYLNVLVKYSLSYTSCKFPNFHTIQLLFTSNYGHQKLVNVQSRYCLGASYIWNWLSRVIPWATLQKSKNIFRGNS